MQKGGARFYLVHGRPRCKRVIFLQRAGLVPSIYGPNDVVQRRDNVRRCLGGERMADGDTYKGSPGIENLQLFRNVVQLPNVALRS